MVTEKVDEEIKEEGANVDTNNLVEGEHSTMVFFVSSPTFLAKVPFDTSFISSPSKPTHSFPLLPMKNFNVLSLIVENHEEEIIRKSKA
ncbi:hypothetical protein R3W88_033477 [Solanum pinnatisectum]|uniref:Uncharacterized protein n=1 Tax=Solanum pinnatisectum TaxID=50273 RepID=A0AAV9K168_9SOLN|nr:hypothetical protein R3W88_033477 [Solanum pinnatisectum]